MGSMRRSRAVIIFHDRTEGPDQQNLKKKSLYARSSGGGADSPRPLSS